MSPAKGGGMEIKMNNSFDSSLYEKNQKALWKEKIKKLNICIPNAKTYNNIAMPMSIVCTRDESKGWFYSNFINIYSLYYNNDLKINYDVQYFEDEVYYLNTERMSIVTFDLFDENEIVKIKKIIDNEKYICLFVDEFYVEGMLFFEKSHFDHELMIYGYNDEKQVLYCSFYGDDAHYVLREVSYDSFCNALKSTFLNRDLPFILYSFHKDNQWMRPYYRIDPKYILLMLKKYIYATNFLFDRRHINPIKCSELNSYGINVYGDIIAYLEDMARQECSIDLRQFYLLYEHKLLMGKRLQYLFEENILETQEVVEQYMEVVRMGRLILNYAIRYNVFLKVKRDVIPTKNNIISKIESIEVVEKKIINDVIIKLSKYLMEK